MRGVRGKAVEPVLFRWDLDKTYLKTEFDSLRGLVRIPFERAEEKVAAPGVAALIRELRRSAEARGIPVQVMFISASPPQIGREIRKKLDLDGVIYDRIIFKDQLHRIVRGKFRHLREQVGYKLSELVRARRDDPPAAREYLFGDDWESDPLIYSLYADVLAGRVEEAELKEILVTLRVDSSLREEVVAAASEIEPSEVVRRIFINLERRSPPGAFRAFGPRLVPTFNYFQTALCLHAESRLDDRGLAAVARSLSEESSYTPPRLLNSLSDAERRGHLDRRSAHRAHRALAAARLLPATRPRWFLPGKWRRGASARPAAVDYRALVMHETREEKEKEESHE